MLATCTVTSSPGTSCFCPAPSAGRSSTLAVRRAPAATRARGSAFYAAPEALRAYMAGEGGVVAAEALDAWSLGVLAIELLTGKPVFNHMQPKEEVR